MQAIHVDDRHRVNVTCTSSPEAIAKLVRGEPVDPAEIYFRCVPTFEVSDPSLSWLTESIFIATGERFPDRVAIAINRVE